MNISKTKLKIAYRAIFKCMAEQNNIREEKLSYATFHGRKERLQAMFRTLHESGLVLTNVGRLKEKHVNALVAHWKASGVSNATMMNRMSDLRWLCEAFGRGSVIKTNQAYGIGKRHYQPAENVAIHKVDFERIGDASIRLSLELQRVFGLRREECLKIKPHVADKGDRLKLQASWTKGGIERLIPIQTPEQRAWLDRAKAFLTSEDGSMIPPERSYIQQRKLYDKLAHEAGFQRLHGLRHAYAQRRYKELTGWESPRNGGKLKKEMGEQEKRLDYRARQTVSKELGHSRVGIARVYLG